MPHYDYMIVWSTIFWKTECGPDRHGLVRRMLNKTLTQKHMFFLGKMVFLYDTKANSPCCGVISGITILPVHSGNFQLIVWRNTTSGWIAQSETIFRITGRSIYRIIYKTNCCRIISNYYSTFPFAKAL